MVTGIETAGLVLAIFPLIVRGLVIYIDGIQNIKRLRRCREVLESLNGKIRVQSAVFRQNIEELFVAAEVFDTEEIDFIFENLDDRLWTNDERNRDLERFLGSSYRSYVYTTNELQKAVNNLSTKLRIDMVSNKGEKGWRNSVSHVISTIQLVLKTMSMKAIDDILRDIQTDNWTIWRLHHGSDYIAHKIRHRKNKRPKFDLMREQIINFGLAFDREQCLESKCKQKHQISLHIPKICDPKYVIPAGKWPCRTYNLVSPIFFEQQDTSFLWNWRKIVVAPHGFEERSSKPMQRTMQPDFQGTGSHNGAPVVEQQLVNAPPIHDVCAILRAGKAEYAVARPIGFIQGTESRTSVNPRHFLYAPQSAYVIKTAPLEWVLRKSSDPSSRMFLPMRERLSIAADLASAILLCIDTIWLKPDWTSKDIIVQYHSYSSDGTSVLYDFSTYVSWQSRKRRRSRDFEDVGFQEFPKSPIKCQTIVALGAVLIEVFFGTPLSSLWPDQISGQPKSLLRFQVANQLLGKIWAEANYDYAFAVELCLQYSWQRRPDIFDVDKSFEKNIFNKIVQPLVRYSDVFCGSGRQWM